MGTISIYTYDTTIKAPVSDAVIVIQSDIVNESASTDHSLKHRRHTALQAEIGKKKTRTYTASNTLIDSTDINGIVYGTFIDQSNILLAYGTLQQPLFQSVDIRDTLNKQIDKQPHIITIKDNTDDNTNVQQNNSANKRKSQPIVPSTTVTLAQFDISNNDISDATQPNKRVKHTTEHQQNVEFLKSLGERLAEQEELSKKLSIHEITSSNNSTQSMAQVKAGSLQTILTQAIHTNDRQLLDYCVTVGAKQSRLVSRTVTRLDSSTILPLLKILIAQLHKSPNKSYAILQWIREILSSHVSYLLSLQSSNISTVLLSLHSAMDLRLVNFHKLLKLSGRLDLLITQINKNNQHNIDDTDMDSDDVNVYNDNSDESDSDTDELGMKQNNGKSKLDTDDMLPSSDSDADALDFQDDDDSDDSDVDDEQPIQTNGVNHSDSDSS